MLDRDIFGLRVPTFNWCWQRRSLGLTGPVIALLTPRQGVICAGTAAVIQRHRPVSPCNHPCWWKQRLGFPLTTALQGTGAAPAWREDVTIPELQPLTCVHHLTLVGLNHGDVFEVGQRSRYARMKYFLLAVKKERVMCSSLWSLVKSAHLHRGPASGFWSANFHKFISETGSKAGPRRLTYQVRLHFPLFKDTCM